MVVGEFVRNYLRENYPDMRNVDRVKHAAIGVELALVPTVFAVDATGFASDTAVRGRRAMASGPK